MTLSAPKTIYGVHSMTLFNRTTFEPFGTMKVLGSLETTLNGDFNKLYGGSSRYPWDAEAGQLDVMINATVKEFPNFAFEKFLGGSVTTGSAEASGNVGSLANKVGTSVFEAATGIATATAKSGSEADLKDGLYVVKAVSATTVDVYCNSDVDFDKGTDKAFEDDLLKITASALTITTTTAVEIPGFGVELTGGSGTIALVTDDTAYFYVRKVNDGYDIITVGQSTQSFPEFGAELVAQKKADGDTFRIWCPKCKGISLPMSLNEAEWINSTVNIQCLYDDVENAVFKVHRIRGA